MQISLILAPYFVVGWGWGPPLENIELSVETVFSLPGTTSFSLLK